jgi:hypothetical protein
VHPSLYTHANTPRCIAAPGAACAWQQRPGLLPHVWGKTQRHSPEGRSAEACTKSCRQGRMCALCACVCVCSCCVLDCKHSWLKQNTTACMCVVACINSRGALASYNGTMICLSLVQCKMRSASKFCSPSPSFLSPILWLSVGCVLTRQAPAMPNIRLDLPVRGDGRDVQGGIVVEPAIWTPI